MRVISPVVDRLAETKFDSHLADLIPHSFGPLDLDQAVTVPLLSEPRNSLIAFCNPRLVTFHVSHRTRTRRPWKITAVAFNAMLDRALEEANVAYAPYSTSPAGLAFGTYEGNIFSGRPLENVAFNPSLRRLHTALAAYVQSSAGLQRDLWSDIAGVALVEVHQANAQHAGTVETLLRSLAPDAELIIVNGTIANLHDVF